MIDPFEDLSFPQDVECERALISTICVPGAEAKAIECAALLQPEHFMHPGYRAIFRVLCDCLAAGSEIHPLTFRDLLQQNRDLGKVGGYAGLLEAFGAEEVRRPMRLVDRLIDLWRRRELMKASAQTLRAASDPSMPLVEVHKQIDLVLHEINTQGQTLLHVYGANEFLDGDIPEAKWMIPGLVPLGVPTVLASRGGIGKSFLCLQMCIALASGKPFLQFEALPPMAAVYFGLEDSKDTFHRRLRSIVDHYRACDDWTIDDDANLRENLSVPYINWRAKGATAYLPHLLPDLDRILDANQSTGARPGVVIIDTLAAVSEGDENTVAALRPIINACHHITDHGYTPIMLHHVGKGQDGSRTPNVKKPTLSDRMSTDWVRGSSSIVDNFRCVIQITPILEHEAEGAGLDPDKARQGGYVVFGATKLNGGQKSDWLFLEQDEHGRWFDPRDGVEILARIRGSRALAALSRQMGLLIAIHEARFVAEPNLDELARVHCADSKNPRALLRQMINRLRKSNLLQKTGLKLTGTGITTVTLSQAVTDEVDNDD